MAFFDFLTAILGDRPSPEMARVVVPVSDVGGVPTKLAASAAGLLVDIASAVLPTGAATALLQTAANVLLGYISPGTSTVLVDISAADWTATGAVPFTLIIGTAGACKVTDANGHDTVIPAMPAGYVHPGLVTKVWKAGTASSNMVAVY